MLRIGSVTRPSRTSHQVTRRTSGSAASAVVRKTWPAVDDVLEHARLHVGVELGQRIVEQEHRRAADRPRHRPHLGQAQGERHQPLLAARAVEAQVAPVHLDQQVVAVRADQRLASARLLGKPRLEGGQEPGLSRLGPEGRAVLEMHRARSGQRGIEPARFRLERLHRGPAARHQLQADPRELLVPRREGRAQPRTGDPVLQEVIAAGDDLAIPAEAAQVGRVELAREAVDEVAAGLGALGQDGQVLPAEPDRAGPGTPFATHSPASVLARHDRAANGADRLPATHLTAHEGAGRAPAEHVGRLGSAERATKHEDAEPFEQIGFALSVRSREDVQVGRRREREGSIVAKIGQFYPVNFQRFSLP